MNNMSITRRKFLALLSSASALPILGVGRAEASKTFNADVEIKLTAKSDKVSIFSGNKTQVYRYQGEVVKGEAGTLQTIKGSYLGPVLRFRKGQKVRIRFVNQLSEESIIHWHGLHIPDDMDGHPRFAVNGGEEYIYEFTVNNRAGTYWFHPHPHGNTAHQAYMGMAGLLIISDREEQALGLPSDEYDLPIVIQDRSFNRDNQLQYIGPSMMGMMQRMTGFKGEQIMINGLSDNTLSVATRPYRLRLLNGSNSRIYKLAWNDDSPLRVIATDGGLLENPEQRPYIMLAPGERIELWVDFSRYKIGTELTLRHLPMEESMSGSGMMGRMMRQSALSSNEGFEVLRVKVNKRSNTRLSIPNRLSQISHYPSDSIDKHRKFKLTMDHRQPGIDHRSFSMTEVSEYEVVKFGALEIWEFQNDVSGGMGPMPHPMHVHGVQFQVIERSVSADYEAAYEDVQYGYIDSGWKDTVLVMPGERVKLLIKFNHYDGMYLYHCHNLEHEDLGMMRNYLVKR
ncbi:MAG: multicopper oxidase domain-containing protein [Gammaproteobacteria bacterium]|nr:multicopper oxidase domain-containing protein [Gammaproteobacteria bacterium]